MYDVSKTSDHERLSYIFLHTVCTNTSYVSQVFNDLGMCQSDYSRSPPKSSKGGDIGTNVFEGFLTKLTFALKSGMCYNQTKDLVVMNSVCSYLFYPPTSPKGGSNQNALYVTAQRLPQLDYNTSELILNG